MFLNEAENRAKAFHIWLQNESELVRCIAQNEETYPLYDDENATTLCVNGRRYVRFVHGNIRHGKIILCKLVSPK